MNGDDDRRQFSSTLKILIKILKPNSRYIYGPPQRIVLLEAVQIQYGYPEGP
jgi:hypothetical protein